MKCALFVSSSDAYSDLWPIFFTELKRHWPSLESDLEGGVFLNTQSLHCSHPDLKIQCTNVGSLNGYGKTLRAGLKCVESPYVLLMMIDYLVMGKVNNTKLQSYFNFFRENNYDCLTLAPTGYAHTKLTSHPDLITALPPHNFVLFNLQAAFWKKEVLENFLVNHEDPWMTEFYGCFRAEKMKLRIGGLKKREMPILYDQRGCLHNARWLPEAVDYLNEQGYSVDYERRGYYSERRGVSASLGNLHHKYNILKTGLRGSFYNLLRCKPIHEQE